MVLTARAKWLLLLTGVLTLALSACDAFMETTSVSDLETEVFQVKATLEQMGQAGTQIAELQLTADNSLVLESERNNAEATAFAAQATLTSMNRGGVAMQPSVSDNAGAGTLPNGTPESLITPIAGGDATTGTTLSGTTTTTGTRQQDGCAMDQTTVFDTSEDQIYVVTTFNNLRAGSVFGVRWMANGALYTEEPECWVPNQDWDQVCGWCSIVPNPTDNVFPAGEWTVELLLDGQVQSQAQFQVMGAAQ